MADHGKSERVKPAEFVADSHKIVFDSVKVAKWFAIVCFAVLIFAWLKPDGKNSAKMASQPSAAASVVTPAGDHVVVLEAKSDSGPIEVPGGTHLQIVGNEGNYDIIEHYSDNTMCSLKYGNCTPRSPAFEVLRNESITKNKIVYEFKPN